MKNKSEFIGIFLRCAIMVLLGLAFNPERDRRYLPFMVIIAFVMLMFFLMKINQSNLKKHQKTILFFFVSLGVTLWLGWVGITLNWQSTLSFMALACIVWFFINLFSAYVRQRRVVSRWNAAYSAWTSGGHAEDYLKEIERCEEEIKNDTGIMLMHEGIPLNIYILVQKIYLLKEMGREQECLALLKNIQSKIPNTDILKALVEVETELSKKL